MADFFKSALRQTLREVRTTLSPSYQQNASKKICRRIQQFEPYRHAKHIALYNPVEGEIDLQTLWQTAPLQGKYCYFPSLNEDKTLSFLPATPATPFKNNRFNIAEPDVEIAQARAPQQIDIIFVPLVAFDEQGTRLGMGAGYYDRTFAFETHPLLIGVAYDFQQQAHLIRESWDVTLNAIITPSTTHWSLL